MWNIKPIKLAFFLIIGWNRNAAMMDIIFWESLILYQFFFSPQVKRIVIIINKHDIYQFPNGIICFYYLLYIAFKKKIYNLI